MAAFSISVVADSTSVQVFSFHALSGGGVQDLSVHAASLADSSSVQDLSGGGVQDLSVQDLSGGR